MYANPTDLVLYQFYKRYNWLAADFTAFQKSLVAAQRGVMEGLAGASILEGFAVSLTGGLNLQASSGIAVGASGYLDVVNTVTNLSLTAPSAGSQRNLVVVRPNVVQGTLISDPVSPNQTDVLTTIQEAVVVVLAGIAANSPVYPTPAAGDTVLYGVRTTVGQTILAEDDVDLAVRDVIGKNSDLSQNLGRYDDRLRAYIFSAAVIGIKPSQLESPHPRAFTNVTSDGPSIFPKSSGGAYNGAAGDSFVNLTTGAITGADQASSAITPVIPAAGLARVACISLKSDDTIAVAYGALDGTRAQCLAGIKSQTGSGAGSVSITANTKPLCFVIVFSADGINVTESEIFDARGAAMTGAGGLLTTDVTTANRTIVSGTTLLYPNLNISSPAVWNVNSGATLLSVGNLKVGGTLVVSGALSVL